MQKEWHKGTIEVYFEDIENEDFVRQSYSNIIADVNEVQVEDFTAAIESLSDLPVGHTVIIEEYKYTR